MKLDKSGRNGIERCKIRGGSDNRPNILSIPQPKRNVNTEAVQNDGFCALLKRKLVNLYNIPSCVF